MNKKVQLILAAILTLVTAYQEAKAETFQYCLSFRDDPSTSIVVGWSGAEGTVHYGTTDEGTNHTAYPLSHGVDRIGNAHGHNRKFARLTGLTPNTMYYFVIYDNDGDVSDRFKFRTLSDDPNDPVSYITGGDSRDGFKAFGVYVENCPSGNCLDKRREGNELVAKIKPDFVSFNGDYVMNQITSNTFNEWTQWFEDWQLTISTDGRMYGTMHTQGNHEDNNDMYEMFDVPQEEYYVLDIHGGLIRKYFLNSELNACSDANQLNWLINDFETHTTGGTADPTWKFVQYHIPTLAMGNGYGLVADQMSCWVNLFQQFDVRLVSESHTHITKWTYPCIANSGGTDFVLDDDGIVYIGEGQWGAPHRNLDFTGANQKPYVKDQGVFDNFFFIQVNKDSTVIRSVMFENVGQVSESTDDNLGADLPNGVTLWTPSNGDHITIYNTSSEDPVSVTNESLKQHKIYPNPSNGEITISFSNPVNQATIEVYSSLGKLCSKRVVSGENTTFSIEDTCHGGVNYIYIKTEDGKVESHKIVIIK